MTPRRHDARLSLRLPQPLLARIEALRRPGELSTAVARRLIEASLPAPASEADLQSSAEPAAAEVSPAPGPVSVEMPWASAAAESPPAELAEPEPAPAERERPPTAAELIARMQGRR
jgi:hypothetical protein